MITGFLIGGILALQELKSMYSNPKRKRAGMELAVVRWTQTGLLGWYRRDTIDWHYTSNNVCRRMAHRIAL